VRWLKVDGVRWRRVAVAVTLSAVVHLMMLLCWKFPATPMLEVGERPPANEVAFELAPPSPPPRKTVVVIVGPGRTASGGSPRQRDVRALRALPAPRLTVGTSAPPAPPATVTTAAEEPRTEDAPAVPTSDVASDPPARSSGQGVEEFEELIRLQGERLAAGRVSGPGGFGDCTHAGCPSATLALDLSGRHVFDSRVSVAPMVVDEPKTRCELPLARRRAVVRLLVTRDGEAAAPRLLESSGQAAFDSCALRHALGVRFTAGTDFAGNPLNVWITLGISGPFVGSS